MRITCFVLIFSLFLLPVRATGGESHHHIIIAIDRAGCDGWIGEAEVGETIQKLLMQTSLPGNSTNRHYYEPGDYLSVVYFRINTNQTDMDVFASPINGEDDKMFYRQFSNEQLKTNLIDKWTKLALQPYNTGINGFSLVSVAKEYALSALKSAGQQVSRTFLVMVTDRHYNGNNFYDEMKALELKQAEQRISPKLSQQRIFSRCYEVQQYYFCKYIGTENIWAGKKYMPKGYVEFYEYLPLQRNFTLSAAINYPTHLVAKKKRNGNYQLEMPLVWNDNNQYAFSHLEAFLNDKDSVINQTPDNALKLDTLREDTLIFDLPSDKSVKNVQLKAWLVLTDGFYNATLMSPDKDGPIEAGRNGLNTLVPIEYEEDATVLGLPICGLLWPPGVDNQQEAARDWKLILLIAVLGLLAWLGYRLMRPEFYKPRAEEFWVKYKINRHDDLTDEKIKDINHKEKNNI